MKHLIKEDIKFIIGYIWWCVLAIIFAIEFYKENLIWFIEYLWLIIPLTLIIGYMIIKIIRK